MFYVCGGVYSDTGFKTLVTGTGEFYGPFKTYAEARRVWWEKTTWKVDDCHHRMFISGGVA